MVPSTTDSTLSSFIEVGADHPFPIQNLPYGVFTPPKTTVSRIGVAIGDRVIIRGYTQGDGYRVGFGTAEGTVLPAPCT